MPKPQTSRNVRAVAIGDESLASLPERWTGAEHGLLVRLRAAERAEAGGKAAMLARLAGRGVAVPDGWVLTLGADRLRCCGQLSDDALDALVGGRLIANYPAESRFAVRSSADIEDSAAASYAGQFRTELNVPRDDVPAAVRRVLASVGNPSARSYARRLGVRTPEAMAVLVQEQVDPVMAGVCFTAHPVTGARAVALEYAHGGGEDVASGRALAASYVLPRQAAGGFDASALAAAGLWAAGRLGEVARLALSLEELLGSPQDVEWAIDGRGLWVLQSRPITTMSTSSCGRVTVRSEV